MSTLIFVGPTLAAREVLAAAGEAVLHPPVAHGDLFRLDPGPGDIVVLIDGYFHQKPSIRHKEILDILDRGVRVIGCSSFGALRAAELHRYGMIGNGVVFRMYRDGVIDADDEVAVAHGEAPEYRKFGVPLVSVRHAVAMAARDGVLSGPEATGLVAAYRRLPYPSRSWHALQARLAPDGADAVRRLRRYLDEHPEHGDIKAADAVDTLRRLHELGTIEPGTIEPDTGDQDWRNRLVHTWRAEFSGSLVDGVWVSDRDVIQYEQIYLPGFPGVWAAFALRGVRDGGWSRPAEVPDDLEAGALAVAAANGIDEHTLTAGQRSEWLTPEEIAGCTPVAAVLRLLVRSYRAPYGIADLIAAQPGLVADPDARTAVAESGVVNAEVAGWAPRRGAAYLRQAVLREHLATTWRADGERSLTAAARDRGFGSLGEAVEAVRPFYLRHHLTAAGPVPAAGPRT